MTEHIGVPWPAERDDEEAVDPRLRRLLGALDPAAADETYWPRFHRAILRQSASELARRRALADLSVTELVSSWARAVVPTALLAAAVAGLLLLDVPSAATWDTAPETVLGVEEVLNDGAVGQSIPAVLSDETLPDVQGALFAAEIF
jgi:hypothetical protein